MSQIRRHALPVVMALLLLGQGPFCELLCAPDAGPVETAAAASHEAMPPCHGGPVEPAAPVPGAGGSTPEPSAHDCASCDPIVASAAVAKDLASQGALLVPTATAWAPAHAPTATVAFAPAHDRAPPLPGRALLLRKSSLLL